MVITAVGLLLVVATALALSWPLLATVDAEPETAGAPDLGARLRSEKDAALAAIREADFDRETGKLSEEDYGALRAQLEERALAALAALDRAESGSSATGAPIAAGPTRATRSAFCPACGQKRTGDAEFCSRCGRELRREGSSGRRRRA